MQNVSDTHERGVAPASLFPSREFVPARHTAVRLPDGPAVGRTVAASGSDQCPCRRNWTFPCESAAAQNDPPAQVTCSRALAVGETRRGVVHDDPVYAAAAPCRSTRTHNCGLSHATSSMEPPGVRTMRGARQARSTRWRASPSALIATQKPGLEHDTRRYDSAGIWCGPVQAAPSHV